MTLDEAKQALIDSGRKIQVVEIGSAGDDPGGYWIGREEIADIHRFDFPIIIAGESGKKIFFKTPNPGSWSLLEPDADAVKGWRHPGGQSFHESLFPYEMVGVECSTLERAIGTTFPDVIKMNIQGAELQVLESYKRKLPLILAVQSEVSFLPYYKGQPIFRDVDSCLDKNGLQLIDFLSFNHIGWMDTPEEKGDYAAGNFRKPSRQIFEGHGLWLQRPDSFMKKESRICLAIIADIYGQTEYSSHVLSSL